MVILNDFLLPPTILLIWLTIIKLLIVIEDINKGYFKEHILII